MALGLDPQGHSICRRPFAVVILLDTNALIWLEQGHVRTRRLTKEHKRLYISPASLLELQMLQEAGRIRFKNATIADITRRDDLWAVDDPPAAAWFEESLVLGWTRDFFDRLLVAHARVRGWRLATADATLLARGSASDCVAV
jgi:PIN domain nuclease of toxin-antitoxin system